MKRVFTLHWLICPPPCTLGEKTQSTTPVVNPVLSPPPLPSRGVRPLAFKNRLNQVEVFCHGETYSSLQSWKIISYFQGQLGENQIHRHKCARKIKSTDSNCFLNKEPNPPSSIRRFSRVLTPAALLAVASTTKPQNLFSCLLLSSENSLLN